MNKTSPLQWDFAGLDLRLLNQMEEIMQTTRRTFLEAVGATAALGVMAGSKIPEALAGERSAANALPATNEKVLFWTAVSTPCDKSLKFDEELYKDLDRKSVV